MSTRTLTIFSVCLLVTTARAQIRVELIPDNPGPYIGGEVITVDVWLHSEMNEDVRLRLVRLDFDASDPALITGPQFTFDFSSLEPFTNYYVTQSALSRPRTENSILCVCEHNFFLLSAGGSLHIGSVPVQLPLTTGTYRLDTLNANDPDSAHGAWIVLYLSEVSLRANSGEITDGRYDFILITPVIPTLSTWGSVITGLLMLLLGTVAIRYRTNRSPAPRAVLSVEGRPHMLTQSFLQTCSVVFLAALIGNAQAQEATIPADVADLNVDSGVVSAQGSGSEPVVLFATTVSIYNAPWTRLHFAEATLSGSSASSNASFLRVTSLFDDSAQVLNASALDDWEYTSAYMRGGEVLLELLAYPNTGVNRVVVDKANFGLPSEGGGEAATACDPDDRIPWTDVRIARFLFPHRGTYCRGIAGCTAFVFVGNQNCFLTAGHCCVDMDPACTKGYRRVQRSVVSEQWNDHPGAR